MEYKVINIIDNYSLIINYGKSDGADVGKKVRIFEEGTPIYDGEEFLGNLDIIKSDLEIVAVYDRFSICKYIKKVTRNPFVSFNFERTYYESEAINVEKEDFSNLKYKTNTPIKVGDKVKIL